MSGGLTVTDLTSGYGDLLAIRKVSVRVPPGSIHLVVGHNGAGKTTLLSTIAGLLPAVSGSILYGERHLETLRPHERAVAGIALVQEGKRIFRRLTVEENLRLGYFTHRRDRRVREVSKSVFELFPQLADRLRSVAGALSGGQQQMLAIGQALMAEPQVLLLDEPTAGLAPALSHELLTVVERLKGAGLAIILVEQSVHQAIAVADDITVMATGSVALSAPRNAASSNEEIQAAYFGGLAKRHQMPPI